MPKAIPKSNNGRRTDGRKRQLDTEEVSSSPSRPVRPRIVVQHRPPEVGSQRRASPSQRSSVVSSTTSPREPSPGAGATSNFLLEALRRIRELQDELDFLQNDPYAEDTDDEEDDNDDYGQEAEQGTIGGQQAEAIGWAVCAQETMHFLQREGIPADSPLVVNLRRRLIGNHGDGSGLPDEGLSC
ncbi:uncharacterized protein LOC131284445 [Anopheles ziemanni]|uniref:uncharacterized protein LOC131258729 n=1 Tax=Anopheles coustani TaxID=139045 RepID=UPI00265A08B9|nr:uncharacterized protein LOC131258729 [Anopheles coustani]XP_058169286.1 uncharacterized protein LOC131284445 [Anopheles ziemanni]